MKYERSVVMASAIAVGALAMSSSLAAAQSGWPGVACWGSNGDGQCNVPTDLGTATGIAGGYYHTIALLADGSIRCWGLNSSGQCSPPTDLGSATAIAGGYAHTIALQADGSVRCWGSNDYGQCNVPTDLGIATAVAGGLFHTIALRADGFVLCWGYGGAGQCQVPVDLAPVTSIAGGGSHTIALRADGSVRCWGNNDSGQCNVPVNLGTATAIAGGDHHTIALRADGSVRCWGNGGYGQCSVPSDLGTAIAIAGGRYHTIALRADGSVRCWGNNWYGESEPGDAGSGITAIAGGENHTVALGTSLPVRAVSPTAKQSSLFPSVQAAHRSSASGWRIEALPSARLPFSVESREVAGLGPLALDGVVQLNNSSLRSNSTIDVANLYLYSSALSAGEKITILGNLASEPNSVIESDLVTDVASVIDIHRAASNGIRTVAPSPTRVTMPIDLAIAGGDPYGAPYDVSTTHRLILDGGVLSSYPMGATNTAVFVTCTAPEFEAVTPCLEFSANSVIDLPPGNKIINHGPTTTLVGGLATLRNGSSIETDADLAIGGSMRIPVGTAVSLSVDRVTPADPALDIRAGGELVVEFGSSVQIAAPAKAAVTGSLTVDQDALVSLLGGADLLQVEPRGDARCFGGTIRSTEMILMGAPVGSTDAGGRLIGVNALIDVDTVRVRGGSASLANGSLVGNLVTEPREGGSAAVSTVAASGQVFGNISNTAGKVISIGDLIVVGNVSNSQGSQILAQVGVLYITGNLVNNGIVFGNVITAPGYNGGGTGGTQVGDGIRVAGSVEVGPAGQLRFVEDLWKFSVCGNVSLACAADDVRFNGAKLSLDGCDGTVQTFEATSRDLGCVASAFSGEETQVSLIGELDVVSGATVQLVDNFNNAPGKDAEVVYARGLTVQPGATLVTNGIKVVTRNALIQGTVDNPANICVVPELPDPDVNGDGHVNGIDLAFILTYWGSSAPIADLNDDGIVNGADMTYVLGGWTG